MKKEGPSKRQRIGYANKSRPWPRVLAWGIAQRAPGTLGELSTTELHPHSHGLGLWEVVEVGKEKERRVDECCVLWKVGQGMRGQQLPGSHGLPCDLCIHILAISPWRPHPRKIMSLYSRL